MVTAPPSTDCSRRPILLDCSGLCSTHSKLRALHIVRQNMAATEGRALANNFSRGGSAVQPGI